MKTALKIIVLLAVFVFGIGAGKLLCAQNQENNLAIIVKNIKEVKGNLIVKIWRDGNYMNYKPYKVVKVNISSKDDLVVNIKDLPVGECGITMFQDINGNDKMDKSWGVKPKEAIGFSNNAKPNFGPPDYDKIKLNFSGNETITINLIQP